HLFFSIFDSRDMLNTSVSIYELRDMSVAVETNLATGEQVINYSKYGLGLPLFLVPFLFLNDILYKLFGDIDSNIILAIPNILVLAAIAQIVCLIIVEMGYGYKRGLFLSLLSIFGTFMFPYAYFFFSEPLQALCITLTFFCLYKARKAESDNNAYLFLVLGGIAYSYGIFTKPAVLIFMPLFALYVLLCVLRDNNKKILPSISSFILPISIFGILIAYLNYYRFGSILDFGYGDEASMFINPISKGILNFIFNPDKSLFLFAPVMLFFPYVLWKFLKIFREEGILIISLIVSNLIFYSAWWAWEGGSNWGPKFLLPLIPLSIIPFVAILHQRFLKIAICFLFAVGFLINLLVVLQDFTGYNYIVLKSTEGMELNIDRPKKDYLVDKKGYKQVPPHVVTSTLPQFSTMRGLFWLSRAKYEGWLNGYGLSNKNRTFQNPPWIKDFPQRKVPDIYRLPKEMGIRIDCPSPILLSYLICPDLKPSKPYFYDALMKQADKAESLGYKRKALSIRRKAYREGKERSKRMIQMSSPYS
ncbi:MAG: hypothetical protein V3T96_05590, partial [Thermodesulfobacteriota bacterium]